MRDEEHGRPGLRLEFADQIEDLVLDSGVQRPGTEARTVQLYFAGPYGIRAVDRPTDRPLSSQQALDLLLEGPTPAEREHGLVTQVPPMAGPSPRPPSTAP